MSQWCLRNWSSKPEIATLLEFLIEKANHARSPLNCMKLALEFQDSSVPLTDVKTILSRINRIRLKIHHMDNLDMETRAQLLFFLSVPVDCQSIGSVIKGKFCFDAKQRIVYYESVDGKLKLKGDHGIKNKDRVSPAPSTQELIEEYFANRGKLNLSNHREQKQDMEMFIDFIFEKCNNISSPLIINQLIAEYNAYGSRKCRVTLEKRIDAYRQLLQDVKHLNIQTKVRHLFGLSAKLTEACLAELQQNASVVVDNSRRIIEYNSYDGSLYLQGKHDSVSKHHQTPTGKSKRQPVQGRLDPADTDGETSEEDSEADLSYDADHDSDSDHQDRNTSSNDSDSNDFPSTSSPNTAHSTNSSRIFDSKKSSSVVEINTREKTSHKRKTGDNNEDTHKSLKRSTNVKSDVPPSHDEFRTEDLDYPNSSSFHSSSNINGLGAGNNLGRLTNSSYNEKDHRQIRRIDKSNNSEGEGEIEMLSPTVTKKLKQAAPAPQVSVNAETKVFKVTACKALQCLTSLANDIGNSLSKSVIQAVEEKIRKYEGSVEFIENSSLSRELQKFITAVTNDPPKICSDVSETAGFLRFLYKVKFAILCFQLKGMEGVLEMIKKLKRGGQYKKVSLEKVSAALQQTLDAIL
ncbi:unnamed protein product [Caenorhabditis brenneri]